MVKHFVMFAALTLVTLVYGTRRAQLLAAGFNYYEGVGYYHLGATKGIWTAAASDCTSLGARLVVINSEAERAALVDFLGKHTKEAYVYAGFTNVDDPSFVTTEGILLEDAGYSTWEDKNPSKVESTCGAINTQSGKLVNVECDIDTMSHVCEHQLWYDYEFFEGLGHYTMHTNGQSWIGAFKTCRSEGSHLAVIDSQEEADVIMGIYNRYPNLPNTTNANVAHVGFRAVKDDLTRDPWNGTYLTIFGTSVSDLGYVKWYSTEPQPGNNYMCGALYRQSASYMMYNCKSRLAFFCEKELQRFVRS